MRHRGQRPVSGDSISFQTTSPINLSSGPIVLNKNLFIIGPGAASFTVSGNGNSQVFTVPSGDTVSISGLTLTNDNFTGNVQGVAINNRGLAHAHQLYRYQQSVGRQRRGCDL